MNDFQEGPDNFNNGSGNKNSLHTKKPSTLLDLLMGIAISTIAYVFIWFVSIGNYPVTITALIDFIILAAVVFLIVKFFRTAHTAAAIIMLILISPSIFVLLLWGACSLMFLQH